MVGYKRTLIPPINIKDMKTLYGLMVHSFDVGLVAQIRLTI